MQALSRQQLVVLALLTLAWGVNWPVMKIGVSHYPPLSFRTLSMWLGLPVLALGMVLLRMPWRIPRRHWPELVWLTATNMIVWHAAIVFALQSLSSGRAAILAYTMPVFSAVLGVILYRTSLTLRGWIGVSAAAFGVFLLLWHELSRLAGRPEGVALMLMAAAVWAVGTQGMRRTKIEQPALTIAFWMTVLTTLAITVLAIVFERERWHAPDAPATFAIVFNAVLVFGFAQAAWLYLAKELPPVASTLSVMLIPVLGVLNGAAWLGEAVHWQDGVAVVLMVVAIASVLWPQRR